jgi:hypothetical protein
MQLAVRDVTQTHPMRYAQQVYLEGMAIESGSHEGSAVRGAILGILIGVAMWALFIVGLVNIF